MMFRLNVFCAMCSENGLKAAEGILSYIGKIKKHDKNDTIYFVDYISTPKENK